MKNVTTRLIFILVALSMVSACKFKKDTVNTGGLKAEILRTEKEFEATVKKSGMQEAFYRFADDIAVIRRANDSLITGKNNIREFYQDPKFRNYDLSWTAVFVDVSNDGTLGYSYGKYVLKITQPDGEITEYTGVFHTVWKRQLDGTWKYVWD
jgi:ketosteroid isomerase-like protein